MRHYNYGGNSISLHFQRSFSPQALLFSDVESPQNYSYFNMFKSYFSFHLNNLRMPLKLLILWQCAYLLNGFAGPPIRSEWFFPRIFFFHAFNQQVLIGHLQYSARHRRSYQDTLQSPDLQLHTYSTDSFISHILWLFRFYLLCTFSLY